MSEENSTVPARQYPVGRTIALLFPPVVGLYGVYQGVQQVLLPAQIASLASGNKESLLAIASIIGGIVAMIALTVGAAISDRTRSRFGRRSPWLVFAAIMAAVGLVMMAFSTTGGFLVLAYAVCAGFANWYQGVLYAVIPDRIPDEHKGTASSVIGLGLPLAILVFVNIMARVESEVGYAILAGFLLVTTAVFVLGAPEGPSPIVEAKKKERKGFSLKAVPSFFSAFRHHDFTMAFLSRLLFFLGFFCVTMFNMYLLTDYIGVENIPGGNAATGVATLSSIQTIAQLLITLVIGKIADKLNRRKLIVALACFVLLISFIPPLIVPCWTSMIIFNVLCGIGGGTYFAVDIAVMSMVLPDQENAGRDLGILALATSIPTMFAASIGSLLIGASGTYASLFVFGIIAALAAGFVTFRIRSVR